MKGDDMRQLTTAQWLGSVAVVLGAGTVVSALAMAPGTPSNGVTKPEEVRPILPEQATADHSKFAILQQEFASGPDVTAACLTCHTEASKQVMKTAHWTWICPRAKKQLEEEQHIAIGKAEHIINNFCIALPSNEPRCTSCHAGYGWEDKSFDFNNENLVDCLVCHDQTGTYKKFPTAAGHPAYEEMEWPKGSGKPWPAVDLKTVAQNVGAPTRHNCGTCHFFGGGGEGVKHGDMDVQLDSLKGLPHRSLDVHMATDGANFNCTQCHTTREHAVSGRCFEVPAVEEREFVMRGVETNLLACESCHTSRPHQNPDVRTMINNKLNDHSDKVSCQACHIPSMAREKATKMWWDWSKAGRKTDDGKPIVTKTEVTGMDGSKETVASYDTKKGEFIWARDAVPEYIWYNNTVKHTFMGDTVDDVTPARDKCLHSHGRYDKIDENKPVVFINRVETGYEDPSARIWPAKVHRGIQPYDTELKTLVIPKLFPGSGPDKGEAYWKIYDWDRAIAAGMAYANLPYSGQWGWIQTEMIWPLKHTVAPKEDALACHDCHARDGRLSSPQLANFYMPGRDSSRLVDILGIAMIAGAIGLALLHGVLRLFLSGKG
jgi:octaheme c-type cytochrome (tetrathionate reductase family)